MGKSFLRIIQDLDAFGHPVNLHFDKQGQVHRTLLGGTASILFYLIVMIITIQQFSVVVENPIPTVKEPPPVIIEEEEEEEPLVEYLLPVDK